MLIEYSEQTYDDCGLKMMTIKKRYLKFDFVMLRNKYWRNYRNSICVCELTDN